jgi:hypothetical protein
VLRRVFFLLKLHWLERQMRANDDKLRVGGTSEEYQANRERDRAINEELRKVRRQLGWDL